MNITESIKNLTPIPLVMLNDIQLPCEGLNIKLNNYCKKSFIKNEECRKHYEILSLKLKDEIIIQQCPSGYCSLGFKLNKVPIALTAFIPFPRLGGQEEAQKAKHHPETKLTLDYVRGTIEFLKQLEINIGEVEKATIQNQSMALHEIRKLNRTIKQTTERLRAQQKDSKDLLAIQKASELMSTQFDIIEILAHEKLTDLELKNKIEIYRLFDKCLHIFQTPDKKIEFNVTPGYTPKMLVCDKTFPLIPTVLIENALKYSLPDTPIEINIKPSNTNCMVSISNTTKTDITQLDERIFQRGHRAFPEKDGSGNGLYIAQLIAKQHKTNITLHTEKISNGITQITFNLSLPTIN